MDIFGIKETKNSKEQQRIVGSEIHPDYQGYLGNQEYQGNQTHQAYQG